MPKPKKTKKTKKVKEEKQDVFISGANLDTRSDEEKAKDYQLQELVSAPAPVQWVEKPRTEWRSFPIFNQDGSGSCVAQTMAKIMGVMYWLKNKVYVHFSATDIYQKRSNKPSGGMGGVEVFTIAQKGATLEVLVPSQSMTDAQMDAIQIEQYKEDVGSIFKIGNYVMLPIGDIETVASTIQATGKPVMVWFFFENSEWGKDVPVITNPNLDKNAPTTARHSVTAVDFTLYQGKKALVIEDSWGFWGGFTGQRIITEDFFKARNFFAAYSVSFKFDEAAIPKPKHTFDIDMDFGQTSEEIKWLQNVLKYEGLFPANVESSGYYGAVTKKGVQSFQLKYKVVANESEPGYGTVGPKTRAQLNLLYS